MSEVRALWRSLIAADAGLYLFRTGLSGGLGAYLVGALFCTLRRRRLVLAASNDLDFIFDTGRGRLAVALYRLALKRTQRIVVQSTQQLELAHKALKGSRRVVLIPSFSEPAETERADVEPEAFLWVGRAIAYKLPLRFVELARSLPDLRFLMVARITRETPKALADELAEGTEALPNLELIPEMRRERLVDLIARSVAVVATSLHEGMPNVFLEAWTRGVPVLSLHFDPDGRIASEDMGICAGGDWGRFVDGARRLWEDRSLRTELGENGRRYATRVHSLDAVARRWNRLLRDVLAGSPA